MIGGQDRFRQVHVAVLALVAIMLPWSEFLLSNAQFLLLGNWLVEGAVRKDLVGRFKRAFTSAPVLVFLSFWLLHAVGLLWTEDMSWGLDLCRILLPVLAFTPVLASVRPITAAQLRDVLLLGAWSAVASALVCLVLKHEVIDQGGYRELSVFISHIRLALMLCLAIAVFLYYWPQRWWNRVCHLIAVLWSIYFLDLLSSLPAFGILAVLGAYAVIRRAMSTGGATRWALFGALGAAVLMAVWYVLNIAHSAPGGTQPSAQLAERSAGGEVYYHDLRQPQYENGNAVWVNVADGELSRAWSRVSTLPYAGEDLRGQPLRYTLVRYLTSMGQRKDSLGALALTAADVQRIEQGIPSVVSGRRDPLRARVEEVLFEWEQYRSGGNASGHSVAMRWEFLRAGWAIARAHPLFGTGTGDTRPAFAGHYETVNSTLQERWRLRAHNEYLTLLISFGVIGFTWCLFSWAWPAWQRGAFLHPLFVVWAIIFGLSCLSEDTLETQMGATFFAFYYALFVFGTERVTGPPATRSPAAG